MLKIFIGLIPALLWGVMPVFLEKTGGTPFDQILGTTIGSCIFGVIISIIYFPRISTETLILGFLSGFFWSIGQVGQYYGYITIGTSKVFPLSSSLQIIGNSLIGGLLLGEWEKAITIINGLIALVIIVLGVVLCNYTPERNRNKNKTYTKVYLIVVFTTIGYWCYSSFPKISNSSALELILPQTFGMVVAAVIMFILNNKKKRIEFKKIGLNILPGLLFGIAAGVYLVSIQLNGVVNAFILSQFNLVLATLIGIYYFKERSTVNYFRVYLGLGMIISGAILIELV